MDATAGSVKQGGGAAPGGEAPLFTWRVGSPWRRFAGEMAAGVAWFGVLGAALLWLGQPAWVLAPLGVAALYVLAPLVVPARVAFEERGVSTSTPFGGTHLPWSRVAGYTIGRGRRAVYLHRTGGVAGRLLGSVTVFLPEEPELAEAALRHLAARLAIAAPAPPGGA